MAYQVSLTPQNVTIINIRAESAALPALSNYLQVVHAQELPATTGIAMHSQHAQMVCIGPDHWLFISEESSQEQQQVSSIQQAVDTCHANATLVTDQHACFLIEGADAREVLCQGCSINLDPDVFHYGHAAACGFTRSKIILIPQQGANQFLILIESSLAEYFEEWVDSSSGKN